MAPSVQVRVAGVIRFNPLIQNILIVNFFLVEGKLKRGKRMSGELDVPIYYVLFCLLLYGFVLFGREIRHIEGERRGTSHRVGQNLRTESVLVIIAADPVVSGAGKESQEQVGFL